MTLELRKFNMHNISFKSSDAKGPVIVMIGRRETGKSYLIRDLLFYHQDVPVGAVISGTEMGNGFYSKMIPKLFIHDEYRTIIIENILNRQKGIMRQLRNETTQYGRTNTDGRTFVILDDCLYDKTWSRDKLMRFMFMNGRHWKIMLIITMQYPLGIPPELRTNIDYVFILREPYFSNRRRIYENYASMFPTFEAFNTVMDQTTSNFECLVLDNNTKSNQLKDQIYWYKAEEHSDFRLGSKEFWDISAEMCNDEDGGNSEPYDPSQSNSVRRKEKIVVKKTKW